MSTLPKATVCGLHSFAPASSMYEGRWEGCFVPCPCIPISSIKIKFPTFNPWVRKIPWRRKWLPSPVFLSEEFHGQRSLVGYIQSMGSQRVGHDWVTLTFSFCFSCKTPKVNSAEQTLCVPNHFCRLHEQKKKERKKEIHLTASGSTF